MEILASKTMKGIIDKRYYQLPFSKFKKELKKAKLYPLERVFLQIIYQFKPTWDIEVEFFLLADTYGLTNKQLFGAIKRLNPTPDCLIKGIELKNIIVDGEFQFEETSIRSIIPLLRR